MRLGQKYLITPNFAQPQSFLQISLLLETQPSCSVIFSSSDLRVLMDFLSHNSRFPFSVAPTACFLTHYWHWALASPCLSSETSIRLPLDFQPVPQIHFFICLCLLPILPHFQFRDVFSYSEPRRLKAGVTLSFRVPQNGWK